MRAAVYRGPRDLRIESILVPKTGSLEILVRVEVCGVCPTDIKKIVHGTVAPPRVFGHETAGTVVRVGRRVVGIKIGERVALHHHVPCLKCHACAHRAFAQCQTYKQTGITAGFEPSGGGFAEYVRVMPFVFPGIVKIPADNTFEEGAMLEPVNTVLKAVKRLHLLPGDNVLVAGQGPIGLMFSRILELRGMNVYATDFLEARLRLAKDFGAKWSGKPDELVNANILTNRRSTEFRKSNLRLRKPNPKIVFDAAVIAVPSDAALKQGVNSVRGGGQVLLFAHTKRGAQTAVDLAAICTDEKDLIGSYSADITLQEEVAELVFSRQLDVRSLISHRFDLERAAEAVSLAANPTPDSLKVLVGKSQ